MSYTELLVTLRSRYKTYLLWFIVLIGYLAVLGVGGTLFGSSLWYGAAINHGAGLAALAALILTLRSWRDVVPSELWGWVFLAFVEVVMAGTYLSAVPRQSALALFELMAGMAVFLLARRCGSRPQGRMAIARLLAVGAVVVVVGSWVGLAMGKTALEFGLFGQRNFFGTYVALLGPVVIGLCWSEKRRWLKWGWGVLILALYGALGYSRSLVGMIGVVGGAGVFAAYWILKRTAPAIQSRIPLIVILVTFIIVAAPIVIGLSLPADRSGAYTDRPAPGHKPPPRPFLDDFKRLLENVTGTLDTGTRGRPIYWKGPLGALQDRPILGFGLRSTPFVYADVRLQPSFGVGSTELDQLHSTPVHLAFEAGWLGLILVVVGFGLALHRGLREPGGALGLGTAFGLMAYAIGTSTNYDLNIEANAATVALALGLLLPAQPANEPGTVGADQRLDRRFKLFRLGLLLAAVGAALAFLVPIDRAHFLHDQALEAYNRGVAAEKAGDDPIPSYRQAVELERRAAALDSHAGFYDIEAGILLERLGDQEGLAGRNPMPSYTEALQHIKIARAAAPHTLDLLRQEACLQYKIQAWPEALEALQQAVASYFYLAQTHFLLGEVYLQLGQPDEAQREFAIALAITPKLAFATRWIRDEIEYERLRQSLLDARQIVEAVTWNWQQERRTQLLHDFEEILNHRPSLDQGGRPGLARWTIDTRWQNRAVFLFRRHGIPASFGPIPILLDQSRRFSDKGIGNSGVYPTLRAVDVLTRGAPEPFKGSPLSYAELGN